MAAQREDSTTSINAFMSGRENSSVPGVGQHRVGSTVLSGRGSTTSTPSTSHPVVHTLPKIALSQVRSETLSPNRAASGELGGAGGEVPPIQEVTLKSLLCTREPVPVATDRKDTRSHGTGGGGNNSVSFGFDKHLDFGKGATVYDVFEVGVHKLVAAGVDGFDVCVVAPCTEQRGQSNDSAETGCGSFRRSFLFDVDPSQFQNQEQGSLDDDELSTSIVSKVPVGAEEPSGLISIAIGYVFEYLSKAIAAGDVALTLSVFQLTDDGTTVLDALSEARLVKAAVPTMHQSASYFSPSSANRFSFPQYLNVRTEVLTDFDDYFRIVGSMILADGYPTVVRLAFTRKRRMASPKGAMGTGMWSRTASRAGSPLTTGPSPSPLANRNTSSQYLEAQVTNAITFLELTNLTATMDQFTNAFRLQEGAEHANGSPASSGTGNSEHEVPPALVDQWLAAAVLGNCATSVIQVVESNGGGFDDALNAARIVSLKLKAAGPKAVTLPESPEILLVKELQNRLIDVESASIAALGSLVESLDRPALLVAPAMDLIVASNDSMRRLISATVLDPTQREIAVNQLNVGGSFTLVFPAVPLSLLRPGSRAEFVAFNALQCSTATLTSTIVLLEAEPVSPASPGEVSPAKGGLARSGTAKGQDLLTASAQARTKAPNLAGSPDPTFPEIDVDVPSPTSTLTPTAVEVLREGGAAGAKGSDNGVTSEKLSHRGGGTAPGFDLDNPNFSLADIPFDQSIFTAGSSSYPAGSAGGNAGAATTTSSGAVAPVIFALNANGELIVERCTLAGAQSMGFDNPEELVGKRFSELLSNEEPNAVSTKPLKPILKRVQANAKQPTGGVAGAPPPAPPPAPRQSKHKRPSVDLTIKKPATPGFKFEPVAFAPGSQEPTLENALKARAQAQEKECSCTVS